MSQSLYSSSSAAGGAGGVGRTAKEMEAFGGNQLSLAAGGGGMMMGMPIPHVVNPDEGQDGPVQQQPQQEPAYFGQQPNYYGGSTAVASPGPSAGASTKPGLITLAPSPSITSRPLVQHQDAGRVEVPENPEPPNEIPPAYDSLPNAVRR